MKTKRFGVPTVRILITGIFALLLIAGVSLSLSHFEAQAQPTAPSDADLTVSKEVSKAQARPEEILAYTITVENNGDESAVLITDALSSELIYIPDTLDANFSDTLMISADDVISWEGTISVNQTAEVWFNAQILTDTTATEIQNTAYVTDTVSAITDSCQTTVISGQIHSQIRSPNKDAYITQKGSMTIEGIAWQEGSTPPYLTDDPSPLTADRENETSYYLNWTRVISAQNYILQESTDPNFDTYDATTKDLETSHLESKGTDKEDTYYYRVQATTDHPDVDPSRWSNVISVTVPWIETTNSQVSPLAATNVSAGDPITVQIRISETAHVEDVDWTTAAVITPEDEWGAEWSYEWDLPEARETPYAIQTRACGEDIECGEIDTITVTLDNKDFTVYFPLIFKRWPPIPYPPTLHDIDNQDQDNNYTVEWTYEHDTSDVPKPISYTLQESQDADFPASQTTEYTVDGTSKEITDQESGTHYYRVRGHNEYGPGEWSEVKDVTVWSYFDDFSDYQSGWPSEWKGSRGALYQVRPYEHPGCGPGKDCKYEDGDGYVIARRNNSDPFARFGPGVEIPSGNYEIEFKSRWFEAQYHATYQIFFDSNKDFDSFYSIKIMIYDPGNDNTCGYQVYGSNGSVNAFGEEIINELSNFTREDAINCGVRNHNGSSTGNTNWNKWRIRREGNKIKIYVNDNHLGTWTASAKNHRYFGVGCTLYEGLTPSKPEFDNWSVKLLD